MMNMEALAMPNSSQQGMNPIWKKGDSLRKLENFLRITAAVIM
jgi:hypothetical protein